MIKIIVIAAALLGLTSLMLGAAGDHLLDGKLIPETAHMFDTALRYHQLYAILIFCAGLFALRESPGRFFTAGLIAWLAGTLLFCGGLYAALFTGARVLTYATPVGGTVLMLGWVLAGFHFTVRRRI